MKNAVVLLLRTEELSVSLLHREDCSSASPVVFDIVQALKR